MEPVVVTQDLKIEIPIDVRTGMNLKPGAKLQVFQIGGRIEMVPIRDMRSMRGRYPGINARRDDDEIDE